MKRWRSVEMRNMINNATAFYNNNAAPVMRGRRICEAGNTLEAEASQGTERQPLFC